MHIEGLDPLFRPHLLLFARAVLRALSQPAASIQTLSCSYVVPKIYSLDARVYAHAAYADMQGKAIHHSTHCKAAATCCYNLQFVTTCGGSAYRLYLSGYTTNARLTCIALTTQCKHTVRLAMRNNSQCFAQ